MGGRKIRDARDTPPHAKCSDDSRWGAGPLAPFIFRFPINIPSIRWRVSVRRIYKVRRAQLGFAFYFGSAIPFQWFVSWLSWLDQSPDYKKGRRGGGFCCLSVRVYANMYVRGRIEDGGEERKE